MAPALTVLSGREAAAASPRAMELLAEHGRPLPAARQDEELEHWQDRLESALLGLFVETRDPRAFEALHEVAAPGLFQWIRWLGREQPVRLSAADLLQDTFVNVYRYAASFQPRGGRGFRAWARTIAANAIRRARSRRGDAQPAWLSLQALPTGLQEPRDTAIGPQASALAGEERRALAMAWLLFLDHYARAFESLSERDRRALELVEVRGLSYAATGAALEVTPSNMKMIMLRSRKRIVGHMRRSMGAAERGRRPERQAG